MIVLLISILSKHFRARMVYAIRRETTTFNLVGGRDAAAGEPSPFSQWREKGDTARGHTSGRGQWNERRGGCPPLRRESSYGRFVRSEVPSVRIGGGAGGTSASRQEPPHSR